MAGLYKLPWEYCECGCRGSVCMDLWISTDNRTNWVLQEGHGILGRSLGKFASIEDMEAKAIDWLRKDIAKKKAVLLREEAIYNDATHSHQKDAHIHRGEV